MTWHHVNPGSGRPSPRALRVFFAVLFAVLTLLRPFTASAQLDPNLVTLSVPGSAERCSEIEVVMNSSYANGHESARITSNGVRILASIAEKCGWGPGPCQICSSGPCQGIGEWNPVAGYGGPLHFTYEVTGTTAATFYVTWDDENVGAPLYKTKTYTMPIFMSGTAVVVVISASPTSVPADGASTSTVTVKVKDQSCKAVPNAAVTVTTDKGRLAAGGQGGGSVTVTTNSAGTATVQFVSATTPGIATVTASAFNASASTPIEMKGCELTVSLNPQVIRADPRASSTITTTLVDGAGAAMGGENVTISTNFSALTGGGTTGSSVTVTTDASGKSTAVLQGVATPQRADITATSACGASASTFVVFAADEAGDLGPNQDIPYIKDPVHPGIGNYTFAKRLFALPGKGLPFELTLYYNSLAASSTGPLGYGWRHAYDARLTILSDEVAINWGSGRVDRFLGTGGTYTPLASQTDVRLTKPDATTYEALLVKPQWRYRFDASGRLTAILDAAGNTITLTHSTQLDRVTDSAGRQVDFTYAGGRITTVTSPSTGTTASFAYDAAGNLTAITDPRGANWIFSYDAAHHLLTFTDANGNVALTNTYDAAGRVTSQADALGGVTTFERGDEDTGTAVKVTAPNGHAVWHHYDFGFNAVEVVDGAGETAAFTYDTLQRRTALTDKRERRTTLEYDGDGNVTRVTDPLAAATTYAYNGQRRATSMVDPLNRTTGFTWDAQGRLTEVREPSGLTSTMTYDAAGLPATLKAFDGSTWTYARNAEGLVTSETDPMGATTGLGYDPTGRINQVTLPGGTGVLGFAHDASGNLMSTTDPLGQVTSYTRDANGNVLSTTFQPLAATTRYAYDQANRPVTVTDPLGGVTTYTYDLVGNVRTVVDPDGVKVTFEYDAANQLVAVIDNLGARTEYGYDANGNHVGSRDPQGRTWRTVFDAASRPVESVDPLGNRTAFTYDALGRLTSVRDALERTASTAYDLAGWPVTTTGPDGSIFRRTFDGVGRLLTYADAAGRTWQWTRDAAGRVTNLTDPAGRSTQSERDALGRVTRIVTRAGQAITMTYDAASQLKRLVAPGTDVQYGYNPAGLLASVIDAAGTTTMTYDTLGRTLSLTDPRGPAMGFSYTAAGRLASLVYPGNRTVTPQYDRAGRLASLTDWLGNVTRFAYEPAGRVTTVALPNGTRTEYGYDGAGRLVTLTHRRRDGGVLRRITLALDGTDRIVRADRTQPTAAVATETSASYTYDTANRLTTMSRAGITTTFASDQNGAIVSRTSGVDVATFGYDAFSRLTSFIGGGRTMSFGYDGRGLRVSKAADGVVTGYLRDADRVYCLLDGGGAVSRYLIDAGQLLYSLGAAGDMRVYHADERGSVIAITDGSGQEVQSYVYGPYGEVVDAQGGLANEFQYLGQHGVMADENGLLHMNARYYLPEAKRFLTEDPIGIEGGPNVYAYAGGDPITSMDPSGLKGIGPFVPMEPVPTAPRVVGVFLPAGQEPAVPEYVKPTFRPKVFWARGLTQGVPVCEAPVVCKALVPVELTPKALAVYETPPRALAVYEVPPKGLALYEPPVTSGRTSNAPPRFRTAYPPGSNSQFPGSPGGPGWLSSRLVLGVGLRLLWLAEYGNEAAIYITAGTLIAGEMVRWGDWYYETYDRPTHPQKFDLIDPEKYINWKNPQYGDNTGGGTKGDGQLWQQGPER